MHPSTWALATVVMVALASFGFGKPVRDKPSPAITLANAALVVKIAELPLDVWEFAWVPGERSIAVLSWESSIDILETDTFKPIRTLGAGSRLVHFAFRSDGEAVAWSENASRVQVNNLRTGKTVVVDTEAQQPRMAFGPDGKMLATGGYGNEAKLWDPATGKLVRSLHAGGEGGLTVLFSPDGKQVAVGNRNDKTHLYETATGKLLHVLHKTMSQELKFSPDGKVLAIAYVNGSIRFMWLTT